MSHSEHPADAAGEEPTDRADADAAERVMRTVHERLSVLDRTPPHEHVAVFEEIHQELSAALDRLDTVREEPETTDGARATDTAAGPGD